MPDLFTVKHPENLRDSAAETSVSEAVKLQVPEPLEDTTTVLEDTIEVVDDTALDVDWVEDTVDDEVVDEELDVLEGAEVVEVDDLIEAAAAPPMIMTITTRRIATSTIFPIPRLVGFLGFIIRNSK